MTIELTGNWEKGFAYDVHTLSSIYLGVDEYGSQRWDTTRSAMGELLYRLKYQANQEVVNEIVGLLDRFKGLGTLDAIIPIPSTNKKRDFQPVDLIANQLGKKYGVRVITNALINLAPGVELKDIEDEEERIRVLKGTLSFNTNIDIAGKNVLLFDDIFRSGSTLKVATEVLYEKARVNSVYVLTLTKTRSRQ